jgi:hypothetical protein
MADTVDIATLFSETGARRRTINLTNECDGTGESAVIKINVSDLTGPTGQTVSSVRIQKIDFIIGGFNYVVLEFNASTNDEIAVLSGSGRVDFRPYGGKKDPRSAGSDGDVVLTTDGNIDGNSYNIIIEFTLDDIEQ